MKPLIVGITGGSGSGKTSLIRALKTRFDEEKVCFISQDDYYKPSEEQVKDKKGIINFDRPSSIYRKEFVQDVKKLLKGEIIEREEYTFNNEYAKSKMLIFKPAPIILVEGLFVFHIKKMFALFDLKIFLDAKENLKIIRRIKRDKTERNYPLDDVLYRYQHHVLPTYEKYIRPYKDEADIVINNNESFDKGLAVLTGYFENYLKNL